MKFLAILILFLISFSSCTNTDSPNHPIDEPTNSYSSITNHKTSVLWSEQVHSDSLPYYVVDKTYMEKIPDPERMVLGYLAVNIGSDCWWKDNQANEDRSNLECFLLSALNLGCQCSPEHLTPLKKAFAQDSTVLKDLETCGTTPYTATVQTVFDKVELEKIDNKIKVNYTYTYINVREQLSEKRQVLMIFEVSNNGIKIISKEEKQAKEVEPEKYAKEIDALVGSKITTCLEAKPRMTHSTGDWHYCLLEAENMEIFVITTTADPDRYKTIYPDPKGMEYQDAFVLKDGALIYAFESIADLEREEEDKIFWTSFSTFKDDLEVHTVSLGHGPTENEEWESSLDKRLNQYQNSEVYNKLRTVYGAK